VLIAGALAFGFPLSASAAVVDIEDLSFDLGQFTGAYVTTNSSYSHGVVFDQAAGVDGYTVGELAGAPNGTFAPNDVGDQLSLGAYGGQEFLTLHYGPGVAVGPGQASLFAVYEQASSNSGVDEEGHYYEVSVNGGTFVSALGYALHQTAISANFQNRIVFDLTAAIFGLNIGDLLETVTIRNITGSSAYSDPDIVFMGRAGVLAAVPLPATLPLLAGALGLLGFAVRKKTRTA
jgi:hypothetical protein